MDTKLQMIRTIKPKLKLKPRKDKVSRLISILETGCYIHSNIGPLLGLKTLLKPEIRDIPAIKNYIKYRYEKQKKKREDKIRKHISKYNIEFSEKKFIEDWMMSMEVFDGWCGICELVKLLHSAVKRGLVDIVKYIIDIDPMLIYSQDENFNNLITIAAVFEHLNVIKFIEAHPLGKELKIEPSKDGVIYFWHPSVRKAWDESRYHDATHMSCLEDGYSKCSVNDFCKKYKIPITKIGGLCSDFGVIYEKPSTDSEYDSDYYANLYDDEWLGDNVVYSDPYSDY